MRLLAQARNPYSRSWLWIPGSLVSLTPRNDTGLVSSELDRLGLVVLAERVEHLGDDALGVEAGMGIHRVRRIMVDELVGQDHRAHPQTAVEHAVVGQRLHHVRTEAADRAFLDGEQHLVVARQL